MSILLTEDPLADHALSHACLPYGVSEHVRQICFHCPADFTSILIASTTFKQVGVMQTFLHTSPGDVGLVVFTDLGSNPAENTA